MSWFSKKVKKYTKEITRPFKKVFKTELNRVIGDVKGEITRSAALRGALVAGGMVVGIPPQATSMAVKSLMRPEDPIKAATGPPILAGPGIVPATGKPAAADSVESWAWAEKYLQSQRKVAQAKATGRPAAAAEELDIEKLVLPAAAVGLAWWLF